MAVSGSGDPESDHCGRQQEQEARGGHSPGTRGTQCRTPYMDLHTGDMPHACKPPCIYVQAAAWPRVEGGSLSPSNLSGPLGTSWTSARLTRSPGVTVTPTAAGGGGGVCAGKEAVISNHTTWDLETEAQAEPVPSPPVRTH